MTRSMASMTFFRVPFDLMFDAVLYSCLRLLMTSLICLSGGMYRLISSVCRPSFEDKVVSIRFRRYSRRESLFSAKSSKTPSQ